MAISRMSLIEDNRLFHSYLIVRCETVDYVFQMYLNAIDQQ